MPRLSAVRSKMLVVLLTAAAAAVWPAPIRGAGSTPFGGSPSAVPGTIPAANFDNGGAGVAYGDTTTGNTGGAYRSTDVDIEPAADGGYDVGWIDAGEWLNYTVAVTNAGTYVAELRVASPDGGGSLHLGFNGPSNVWTSVAMPATGGWQNWTTVSVPVTLGLGQQVMTLVFDTGGFNIESIAIVVGGGGAGSSGTLSPFNGAPAAVPGTILAANFDNGGAGVAYGDTTIGNTGGAYRATDVDIEPSVEGSYDVGWIDAGEWLNYTVAVAPGGSYVARLRVASPSGGALHLGFNGPSNVWTAVAVPGTGGWQNWTTVSVPVTLGPGQQLMTLGFDTGGFNIESIRIDPVSGTTPSIPRPSHVYVVVMENHEFSEIIGNPAAPYINALAAQYGLAAAYTGVTHPSLPNYMALVGGNTYFTDDCVGCTVNASNLADQIEAAGLSWKAYMEDMPNPCGTQDTVLYATKHDPFIHFDDIVGNASRCSSHVVPLTTLSQNLGSRTVPDFVWITPNLCSDMHDCSVAAGDTWLSGLVPQLAAAPDFATSVLFIVWDEGTTAIGGGGLVPLLVVSPRVPPGTQSALPANHFGLLRTIEDGWGLPHLGQAEQARPLSEFFVVR